jgi:hypothetical protein
MMIWTSLTVLLLSAPLASSDIHKCVDEDGNVAYQQTPCPEPVESEPLEPLPASEPEPLPVAAEKPPAEPELVRAELKRPEDVEACKIPLREAIDEIEAEMLRGYSAERGEEFKQELRVLTEAMRACE